MLTVLLLSVYLLAVVSGVVLALTCREFVDHAFAFHRDDWVRHGSRHGRRPSGPPRAVAHAIGSGSSAWRALFSSDPFSAGCADCVRLRRRAHWAQTVMLASFGVPFVIAFAGA